MDLSVITVTYQSKGFIEDLILSVALGGYQINYEHIIVDNASTDGTAHIIEEGYSTYATLIKSSANLGFSGANNLAVKHAKGRYFLFLNPDMKVLPGSLDAFVYWMDGRPEAGIAGCKLINRQGLPHEALRPRRFPPMGLHLLFFLRLDRFFPRARQKFHYVGFEDDREQEVASVRGAFLLMRREIVDKLGWAFDPRYFILFEDLDICREVKNLGYKVIYTPVISCIDYFHQSFSAQTSLWKYRQMAHSLWQYCRKWHRVHEWIWLLFAIPLGFFLRLKHFFQSPR